MRLALIPRFLLLLLCLAGGFDLSVAQLTDMTSAEQAYQAGNFSQAADIFQRIINQGLANGEIYYNLGNCHYKMGQYGRAILNYERAQRLLGDDSDLEVNLRLANLNVPDRIEPLPRFFIVQMMADVAHFFSPSGWAALFIASEWILLVGLVAMQWLKRPRPRRLVAQALGIAFVAFIISGAFFWAGRAQQKRTREAVTLVSSVEARSAPEENSTELFTLHEGAKFRILRQVSGWAEIRLADGKLGWVPQTAFEVI